MAAFSKQRGITFPLLSDAGSVTIKQYGILNPVPEWGLGPDKDDPAVRAEVQKYVSVNQARPDMVGMSFPGTFIVDRQGRVNLSMRAVNEDGNGFEERQRAERARFNDREGGDRGGFRGPPGGSGGGGFRRSGPPRR